jgi:hypothetical protein
MGELQRSYINLFPSWVCIALLVLTMSACVLTFFILIEKKFPHWIHKENSSFLPTVTVVTSANYGFLLGFVVIVLWQAFNTAQSVTTAEANRLALIVYDSAALPQPIRGEVIEGVGRYVKVVVEEEWPVMKIGQSLPKAQVMLNNLFYTLQSYSPETDTQKTFYREIIANLNFAIEKRRERIASIESILTNPLRLLLVMGVFIIAFFLTLLETQSRRVHMISVMLVGAVVAFNMGVAMNLDYPFSGDVAVSNKAFVSGVLSQFKSM